MATDNVHSSAGIKREQTSETELGPNSDKAASNPLTPHKKQKRSEHYLELKWYNWNDDEEEEHSIFADTLTDDISHSNYVRTSSKGECHERNLTLCLVDSKSEDRNTLISIEAFHWVKPTNLMQFNILSQELANFARVLWEAANRDPNLYNDMAIEFGNSEYSRVEIHKLVEEASNGSVCDREQILYFDTETLDPAATEQDALELLKMIFSTFSKATVIAHETDFKGMGIPMNDLDDVGCIRVGNKWFAGPDNEYG